MHARALAESLYDVRVLVARACARPLVVIVSVYVHCTDGSARSCRTDHSPTSEVTVTDYSVGTPYAAKAMYLAMCESECVSYSVYQCAWCVPRGVAPSRATCVSLFCTSNFELAATLAMTRCAGTDPAPAYAAN